MLVHIVRRSLLFYVYLVQQDIDGKAYYTFEFIAQAPNYTRHALSTISIGNGKKFWLQNIEFQVFFHVWNIPWIMLVVLPFTRYKIVHFTTWDSFHTNWHYEIQVSSTLWRLGPMKEGGRRWKTNCILWLNPSSFPMFDLILWVLIISSKSNKGRPKFWIVSSKCAFFWYKAQLCRLFDCVYLSIWDCWFSLSYHFSLFSLFWGS